MVTMRTRRLETCPPDKPRRSVGQRPTKFIIITVANLPVYRVSKNILNIFDCNLKKDHRILIVFCKNILRQLAIK